MCVGCLCGFSQNKGAVPVNKNLWSTSFGLVTGGLGLVGLFKLRTGGSVGQPVSESVSV